MYPDHNFKAIDEILEKANHAFFEYKRKSLAERAQFLYAIAKEIEENKTSLIAAAHEETNLSEKRLLNEIKRTIFQLTGYADAAERGDWLCASIDTGDQTKQPPKPDLRKMLIPLGPVVVFGASNFPFAYSTAGGDTACALAAGCPVLVKAHPAHPKTSTLVANAIFRAALKSNMPEGVFSHIYGANFEVGAYLVKHQLVKAVGFTGSYSGGRALFDLANQRENPIPVFAEMGSVNPVFLLPQKLKTEPHWLADRLAKSITQDMGQFCTNPGVVIAIKGEDLSAYKKQLIANMADLVSSKMLHKGIASNYNQRIEKAMEQNHVQLVFQSVAREDALEGMITITEVPAKYFIENKQLQEEVFGPYSIIVTCNDEDEMLAVAHALDGQLTTTLMATPADLIANENLLTVLREKCGRFVLNNVPTGVDVVLAMQHGGPFPSSTDSRFTAVGADGIKRFARPLSFQNWDNDFLPEELKDENPLKIWRTVNNKLVR